MSNISDNKCIFYGFLSKRKRSEYVAEIIDKPFFDKNENKWSVIVITSYYGDNYTIIKNTRILKYNTKEEVFNVKVGMIVNTRYYYEWI